MNQAAENKKFYAALTFWYLAMAHSRQVKKIP
jgi:hypothetical protein